MPRVAHGSSATPDQLREAHEALATSAAEVALGFAVAAPLDLKDFDFLFPRPPGRPGQPAAQVGRTPSRGSGARPDDARPRPEPPATATIPAVYTYFGQFVDHDITLETGSSPPPSCWSTRPGPAAARRRSATTLHNLRTATLDLDSVYGPPAPRDPANRGQDAARHGHPAQRDRQPSAAAARQGRRQRPAARAAQRRPRARPRGADRRPAQRREPHHRPAAPGLPEGAQRAGRPGPRPSTRPGGSCASTTSTSSSTTSCRGSPTRRSWTTS